MLKGFTFFSIKNTDEKEKNEQSRRRRNTYKKREWNNTSSNREKERGKWIEMRMSSICNRMIKVNILWLTVHCISIFAHISWYYEANNQKIMIKQHFYLAKD